MGDEINNPWNISIELNKNVSIKIKHEINNLIVEEIKNHTKITEALINGEIKLNSY